MKSRILRVTMAGLVVSWLVSEFVGARAIQWGKTAPGCQAYTEALVDRAQFVARTVMTSPAFRQCSTGRLGTRYKNCDDPNKSDARAVQIAKILKALDRNNPLEYSCGYALGDGSSARAFSAPWGEHAVKSFDLADDWMESFSDWSWYRGLQPFNWRASDIVHEFLHTHNYQHPDSGCSADYGADGIEHSAPYIVGDCVSNVIEESMAVCPIAPTDPRSPLSAPAGALSLVRNLREHTTGAQVCETVFDPGLRVAFRTSGGQFLRAVNGGGAGVDARAAAHGPWETLHVIDVNGGPLWSGEIVRIKTPTGHYLARAADGTLTTVMPRNEDDGPTFVISRPGGSAVRIAPGDPVQLKSGASFVTAEDGGTGAVTVNRPAAREWETFMMVGPRRANVVRLVTAPDSRVVYVRGDGRVDASRISKVATDELSAFWVIDHSGGTLQSGDEVTFETLRSSKFIGTCQTGSESLTATADSMRSCGRFVMTKAGGGRIQHGDTVTLLTPDGRAMGVDTDGTLMRRPASLAVGFVVRAVQGTRWPIE